MPDSEPDLYSFLRSKDLPEADEEADAAETNDGSADDDHRAPDVQVVDSFENGASSTSRATLNFEDDDLVAALQEASRETLDKASFGIVQVDNDGVVQFYNQYESELAGVPPDEAVGRNFFTELAPCSGNRLFHGRFKKGMKKGVLDERFTYTFTYKMTPTLVDVRMHRDEGGRNWILIRKR